MHTKLDFLRGASCPLLVIIVIVILISLLLVVTNNETQIVTTDTDEVLKHLSPISGEEDGKTSVSSSDTILRPNRTYGWNTSVIGIDIPDNTIFKQTVSLTPYLRWVLYGQR